MHGEGQSRDGFASENNLVQTRSQLDRIESSKTDQVLQRFVHCFLAFARIIATFCIDNSLNFLYI